MIAFKGKYFDGTTSKEHNAEVHCDGRFFYVEVEGFDKKTYALKESNVTARLANTPRKIFFPDRSLIETPDNDTIDGLARKGYLKNNLTAHHFENKKKYIFGAIAGILAVYVLLITVIIPKTSHVLAKYIPHKALVSVTDEAITYLDKLNFKKSNLSEDRQHELTEKLAGYSSHWSDLKKVKLLFRDSPIIGANALALPDGTIIMTDQLVEISKNDLEILAVLFHEVGHIKQHHSARLFVENAFMTLLVSVVLGDISFSSLPLILMQNTYSRNHESESDKFSVEVMDANNIKRENYKKILLALQQSHIKKKETKEKITKDKQAKNKTKEDLKNNTLNKKEDTPFEIPEIFLTHPNTKKRLKEIDNY